LLDVPFVLDTTAPLLSAALTNDTGASGSDGVTSDPTIGGVAQDQSRVTRLDAALGEAATSFSDISDLLTPGGQFFLAAARLEAIAGSPLELGAHVLRLRVTDEHGQARASSVAFTLEPEGLFVTNLALSVASDSLPAGDQRTNAGRVVLTGQTQPLATLTLLETNAKSLANSEGLFQFPGVTLNVGPNTFTIKAQNAAGDTAQAQFTLERVAESAQPDPVLLWNQAALSAARQDAATPTYASRAYAMVHTAIFDAVAAIERSPSYLVALPAPAGASLEAAIAGAGERVLSYLFPAQQTGFTTTLNTALAIVPDGPAETAGLALGRTVADAVIAVRNTDGWDDFEPLSTGNAAGDWQFTPPMYDPFLTPQWATLQPFAMTTPAQFRPAGPPDLTRQAWADAYNEVRLLGEASSPSRTADQTQIARFWADGAGTFTPAGHWNQIASLVAGAAGNSVAENARLFAMLNIALPTRRSPLGTPRRTASGAGERHPPETPTATI
jgi:hypothetical protein